VEQRALSITDMEFACAFVPKLAEPPTLRICFTRPARSVWRARQTSGQYRSFQSSVRFSRESESNAPSKVRGQRKVFDSVDEAVADIKSGSTVLSAGFGLCGTAETIIGALHRRGPENLHSLTAVSNNAGTAIGGGLSPLIAAGQVSKAICSFLGNNKALESKYLNGEIAIELTPQGTLAEKLRCGGAGIPVSDTGVRDLASG
jgi:3-oxoacid CoA-transferase